MEKLKKAFVIMPFHEPFNSYYTQIYKPALESVSYIPSRADDVFTPRPIMLDIQASICEADLILCEMSERNPNVFYELGLAHAIGRPAILVARKEDDIPFDLRHIRTVVYDYSLPGWENKLKQSVASAAIAVNEKSEVWPPPLLSIHNNSSQALEVLMKELQDILAHQQLQLRSKVIITLTSEKESRQLPVELSRADLNRAEIIGRIGIFTSPNMRFSLKYLNTSEFLKRINEIKADQSGGDVVLTIPCTDEEINQFR